ncbi:MAG: hypothetical protein B0D91_07450 [Oceanospirillales bacterium LUC14_002_19_P2]|nr:MAG: hypothetical protein B0D91_07450 [Oceanospirillales bacterium LUC14_002_19_P2]
MTFTKSGSPVCIKYDYIKTDSNADAFSKLEEKLNCTFNEFDEMKSNIIASTTNLPDFRIVNGDVKNQIEYLERHSGDSRLVILNASQLNYQEQLDENHDIKDNIAGVYNDRTFGPGVVKTQKGGPEFLAHLLIDGNRIEFYGAFCDFFTAAKRSGTPISAQGGYYKSDMTSEQWNTLKKELCSSETHVQGLRWRKCNGTIVYQTGAINSGGDEYWYLHNKEKPTEAFEFAVIFLQFRNALLEETNKDGFVDIHTTRIGEGVFGNHQFVSMLALRAALLSLPEANRSRIRTVNIGTYTKEEQQNTEAYLGELFKDMVPVGR